MRDLARSARILSGKLRNARGQLSYLPQTLALLWESARGWTIAWAGLLLVQGLLPVAVVSLTRPLVDSIVVAVTSSGDPARIGRVALMAGAMVCILLLIETLSSLTVWVRTAQGEQLQDHIRERIHRKSLDVDLSFYDSAEFHDRLHRARSDGHYRSVALVDALGGFAQNIVTLVAMAWVVMSFGVWLPIALIATTLPALYIVTSQTLRRHEWRLLHTEEERRTEYYDETLTSVRSAAEIRLFGLGPHFTEAYNALRLRLRRESIDMTRAESVAEAAAGAFALLIGATALGWVFWRATRGLVSLGELALFYQAFQQGMRLGRMLLESVGQVYGNALFLGNLFAFLAIEPAVKSPPSPRPAPRQLVGGLTFRGVTFSYPGSSRPALDCCDLKIPAGRIVAVVGPNGGGKSTLVKLICRFYDPQAGRIDIDGIDVRDFAIEDLRGLLSVLFQQPVHYNDTAADNIAFGDLPWVPGAAEIRAAAEAAGAAEIVERLPDGYQTLLGRSFSAGTELSLGEWQRIALARAFLRRAPILVLDEPTSSLDPWAEAEWLERSRLLGSDRTTIVITHRLTTAMRADLILVVSEGRVVESGSHRELLACGGLYAQSWSHMESPLAAAFHA